jgi:hypothetical protein
VAFDKTRGDRSRVNVLELPVLRVGTVEVDAELAPAAD